MGRRFRSFVYKAWRGLAFRAAYGLWFGGVDADGMITVEADAIFSKGEAVGLFKGGANYSDGNEA